MIVTTKTQRSTKVLRDDELPSIPGRQITPAMIANLPEHCFFLPIEVLKTPEPIKHND